MPRDKRDSIRIFWIEQDKEKSVRIYPTDVPDKKWENGIKLYTFGLTQVCRYFNVLVPDDLEIPVRWCYDFLPSSDINSDLSWIEQCEQIYNTDEFKFWYQLERETCACESTDSMFSDAYKYLIEACRTHEHGLYDRDFEDVDEHLTNREWKEPYWVNYLFDEYIGNQKSRVDTGAWIFRDGSYITVEAGNHRRICEGYMGISEKEAEMNWVKIQLYGAYTHSRMTDAQKKTLNKFFKQYEDLYESNVLWERERNSR